MRSLIVLLLLAVFFLTGLVVGMDREQNAMDASQNTEKTSVQDKMQEAQEVQEVMVVEQTSNKSVQTEDAPMNLTQKAAMFLEDVVGGIYEMIVGMLYQVVQLFF
ncbi:hypothetical protein [Virgibacillus doumboii]|uniref:hypothetical protein n=1 Tax=Virgibacillus doumboii TaxID=2697503 RepID=UPI0013DEE29D|nr:hypothetical protein [Virgibacillus doumboii]